MEGVLEVVLNGDGHGGVGFFADMEFGGKGEDQGKGAAEQWGMEKVLDLDMERR